MDSLLGSVTRLSSSRKVVYKAVEGSSSSSTSTLDAKPTYGYALDLISLVCNNAYIRIGTSKTYNHRPYLPHRVLDKPPFGYTIETEPEKERLMRLQVRLHI